MRRPDAPFDLASLLGRATRERPNAVALRCDGVERTYGQLHERALGLAAGLRGIGLEHGDHVAILLDNRIEYPEVDFALAAAGLVRVALNVRLNIDELAYVIDDSGCRALITESAYDDEAAELTTRHELMWIRIADDTGIERGPLDYEELLGSTRSSLKRQNSSRPAWISYTSGTTGKPKGVVLSHRSLIQTAFNIMAELGPINGESSILLAQPLSHGAGFFVLPYLAAGARVEIMRRFDPDLAVHLGTENRIRTFKVVPTMLRDLLDTNADSPFQTIVYGAAAIAPRDLEEALDRFGPILTQIYGQSEAPVTITVLHKGDHARPGPHRGSAGRAWRTVDVQVMSEDGRPVPDGELGELTVSGAHLMSGYLNLPDLTAEVMRDGRLWTRDMAIRDDEGFFYLRGRRDEMINSGGFNIAPKEIEDVVSRHPAVAECVAVGIPDERWGQAVQVHVKLIAGRRATSQEIVEYCRPLLGFRRPRSVVFVDHLPRTAYGKVDRAMLLGNSASEAAQP